jgi:hypothetical protein
MLCQFDRSDLVISTLKREINTKYSSSNDFHYNIKQEQELIWFKWKKNKNSQYNTTKEDIEIEIKQELELIKEKVNASYQTSLDLTLHPRQARSQFGNHIAPSFKGNEHVSESVRLQLLPKLFFRIPKITQLMFFWFSVLSFNFQTYQTHKFQTHFRLTSTK